MFNHSSEFDPAIFQRITTAYINKNIAVYKHRLNSGVGRSQSLGILPRRNYGVGESRNNDSHKEILKAAKELAAIICPDLNWTTLAINKNYQAEAHNDKNNDGISCVVAFGDYTGGELEANGALHDLRFKPLFFEASKITHSVKPITSGERFSIVFFRPNYPSKFVAKYGSTLTYDEIYALIPKRGYAVASSVRVPY